MIILDTNVVSELMKADPDPRVEEWLGHITHETLTTSVITVSEIVFGIRRLPSGRRRNELAKRFTFFINRLGVLSFEVTAAFHAGEFRALREDRGLASHPSDMMIAGIAASQGAKLATRNRKDFELLPLEILDPWRVQ